MGKLLVKEVSALVIDEQSTKLIVLNVFFWRIVFLDRLFFLIALPKTIRNKPKFNAIADTVYQKKKTFIFNEQMS